MALEYQLKSVQVYFFAALSGIFLYISLASLFPVLASMIEASDGLEDLLEEVMRVELFLVVLFSVLLNRNSTSTVKFYIGRDKVKNESKV